MLALTPVLFTLGERDLDIYRTAGWVDARHGLDADGEEKLRLC
jgi:hypothetical protein